MRLLIAASLALLAGAMPLSAVHAADAQPATAGKASPSVVEIKNQKEFDALIAKSATWDGTIVVDFHAHWCGPCKQIGPILEELAKDSKGKVVILKVNVDDNNELSQRFKVEGIPALFKFQKGKQVDQTVGGRGKDELKKWIGM